MTLRCSPNADYAPAICWSDRPFWSGGITGYGRVSCAVIWREQWASCGGLSVMRSAPIGRNCTICAVLARNVGSRIRRVLRRLRNLSGENVTHWAGLAASMQMSGPSIRRKAIPNPPAYYGPPPAYFQPGNPYGYYSQGDGYYPGGYIPGPLAVFRLGPFRFVIP